VQLVSKISNLCAPDPPIVQTDGQTTRNRNTVHDRPLRYAIVHRMVKTEIDIYNVLNIYLSQIANLANINLRIA